jgi:hypothetical protein
MMAVLVLLVLVLELVMVFVVAAWGRVRVAVRERGLGVVLQHSHAKEDKEGKRDGDGEEMPPPGCLESRPNAGRSVGPTGVLKEGGTYRFVTRIPTVGWNHYAPSVKSTVQGRSTSRDPVTELPLSCQVFWTHAARYHHVASYALRTVMGG